MKVLPLGDWVLVQPQYEVLPNGIIQIPDSQKQVMTYGEVIAKGPKTTDTIKIKDNVFFGSWCGVMTEPSKKHSMRLIKEHELIGLVDLEEK